MVHTDNQRRYVLITAPTGNDLRFTIDGLSLDTESKTLTIRYKEFKSTSVVLPPTDLERFLWDQKTQEKAVARMNLVKHGQLNLFENNFHPMI